MAPKALTFLDFPGEIRNEVYAYLLVLPSWDEQHRHEHHRIYPALLSTSRRIYAETLPFLYTANTFLAHSNRLSSLPRLRHSYPYVSSSSVIKFITKYHINVRLDCDPNFSREKAKEAFTGVEELTIEVFQAQYGSSDFSSLTLFEGVRGVRSVRIFGSVGNFPQYVEWLCSAMACEEGVQVESFRDSAKSKQCNHDLWLHGGR